MFHAFQYAVLFFTIATLSQKQSEYRIKTESIAIGVECYCIIYIWQYMCTKSRYTVGIPVQLLQLRQRLF